MMSGELDGLHLSEATDYPFHEGISTQFVAKFYLDHGFAMTVSKRIYPKSPVFRTVQLFFQCSEQWLFCCGQQPF